ncbi:MAG: hypothetical protein LBT97_13460 [Planctomycetota bacterium]|jgi:hypothetical protein|nr:hypothetical protein [Planctomycetota bacterium]
MADIAAISTLIPGYKPMARTASPHLHTLTPESIRARRFLPFAAAVLFATAVNSGSAPSGQLAQPRGNLRPTGEDYSRSGAIGDSLRVRIPFAAQERPQVPKDIDALRTITGSEFVCLERANFLIASDLEFDEYEYLIDGVFDYCRRALINAYFDRLPYPGPTINLFVFRDYDSYANGLRRFFNMDPISPYGHYGHSQKYLVINFDTGPGTMVHEMTHALMADDFPEAPIWLAEGLASLYEQCRAEGGTLRGDDNWRLPELKTALAGDALTPLSRLLAMSPADFRAANESLHYAQARYLCKYLEDLGILAIVYKDFRDNHRQDPSGARFLAKAFGRPLAEIESAWKRWLGYQNWQEDQYDLTTAQ